MYTLHFLYLNKKLRAFLLDKEHVNPILLCLKDVFHHFKET